MIYIKIKAEKLAMLFGFMMLLAPLEIFAETKQEHVHSMSHHVMPFDMSKTIHVFRMTDSGGVMKVISRDAKESDQIELVQQHLTHEAEMFKHGNYSDPLQLHGSDMPGVKELSANYSKINISYIELTEGAQLIFKTDDRSLVTAIHRWFGAQLSEHGADAKAE